MAEVGTPPSAHRNLKFCRSDFYSISTLSENSLVRIATAAERCYQFCNVFRAPRLHRDVDGGVPQIHSVIRAIVCRLDDIGPMICQNSGEPVQRSWIVRQVHPQANKASIFYQSAFDDTREQRYIDVPAAHQHCRSFGGKRELAI